jgi:hypothetical protein
VGKVQFLVSHLFLVECCHTPPITGAHSCRSSIVTFVVTLQVRFPSDIFMLFPYIVTWKYNVTHKCYAFEVLVSIDGDSEITSLLRYEGRVLWYTCSDVSEDFAAPTKSCTLTVGLLISSQKSVNVTILHGVSCNIQLWCYSSVLSLRYVKLLHLWVIPFVRFTLKLIHFVLVWCYLVGGDSSVGIVATCCGLDVPGIESRWDEIFRTLWPTQPPIQWVLGSLSQG